MTHPTQKQVGSFLNWMKEAVDNQSCLIKGGRLDGMTLELPSVLDELFNLPDEKYVRVKGKNEFVLEIENEM